MNLARALAATLALSAINLALMVPGGFVETRNFPGYSITTLATFNIFLTTLGLGSLVLAYKLTKTSRASIPPILVGLAYILVYTLDLTKIFPIAAVPMSALLTTLEALGVALGALVAAIGLLAFLSHSHESTQESKLPTGLTIALVLMASAIVAFATFSAM